MILSRLMKFGNREIDVSRFRTVLLLNNQFAHITSYTTFSKPATR